MDKEQMQKIGRSNVRRSKSHERRIAHLLTEWTGEEFRRRRVEGRDSNVVDRESTADVIPANKQIIFSIEAKCGECVSLDGMLANPKKNKWTVWWHQSCYDAIILSKALGKEIWPMMFFKPHPNFDWVAIAKEPFKRSILKSAKLPIYSSWSADYVIGSIEFPALSLDMFSWLGPIEHNVSQSKKNPVLKAIQLHPCYIMRWKDFAENIDPKSIFAD